MCGHPFPSRNKLFRHYNDANEACGAWCASTAACLRRRTRQRGKLERPTFDPRTLRESLEKSRKSRARSGARNNGDAATARRRAEPPRGGDAELWVGGLHGEHAYPRALKRLVHAAIPGSSGIDQPIVRLVVERAGGERNRTLDRIRVRPVQRRGRGERRASARRRRVPGGGRLARRKLCRDSETFNRVESVESRQEQLRVRERRGRVSVRVSVRGFGRRHRADADDVDSDDDDGRMTPGRDPSHLAVAARGETDARGEAHAAGLPSVARTSAPSPTGRTPRSAELTSRPRGSFSARVPRPLLANLRGALDAARWPPVSHRPKVDSERYLVLRRGVLGANDPRSDVVDPYAELKNAANAVLRWADPTFEYDHLAITRNFVGSPHVDEEDKSHRRARAGGLRRRRQLCVESEDERRGGWWIPAIPSLGLTGGARTGSEVSTFRNQREVLGDLLRHAAALRHRVVVRGRRGLVAEMGRSLRGRFSRE